MVVHVVMAVAVGVVVETVCGCAPTTPRVYRC